jgi:predicted ferric reductase
VLVFHPVALMKFSDWTQPIGVFMALMSLSGRIGAGRQTSRTIEGPYGCVNFIDQRPRQIWVGGGIGITPFVARLKMRANAPGLLGSRAGACRFHQELFEMR